MGDEFFNQLKLMMTRINSQTVAILIPLSWWLSAQQLRIPLFG